MAAGGEEEGEAGAGDGRNIIQGYKPNNNLVPLLGGTKEDFYTDDSLLQRIKAYAETNGLLSEGGAKVDTAMMTYLYVKFKEEERPKEGDTLSLLSLSEHFKMQMTEYYSVEIDGKIMTHKGKPKKVALIVEERMGGRRACTILRNLEYFGIAPESLVKAVQKKFNTSGAVAPLPGKNETKVEITLQGNLLTELLGYLAKEHGLDKHAIEVTDKTKK